VKVRNVLVICLITQGAIAGQPKVTQAVPADGSQGIDPASKELRIVFDQPMAPGGWSVVGGGETFPKFVGKARWEDDRTFVWSWRLEPDHDYWLSINSDRFANFRGTNGEPAVPRPISFRTGQGQPGGASAQSGGDTRLAENREAVVHLRRAIDEDYSYRDLRPVDWVQRFAEFKPKLEAAATPRGFAELTAQLLAPAQDIHLWLKVGEESIPTYRRSAPWNVATAYLPRQIPGWRQRSAAVFSGIFEDGIRYVFVRSWPADNAPAIEPAFEVLAEASEAGNPLIVDVRANGGGVEPLAQQFAGCFVEKPVAYAKNVIRRNGQFSDPIERVLQPNRARPRFRGRVVVLMGQGTVSSSESFVMMMKQAPGCTLVGDRTAGSSGNPKPADLGNGVTVFVPSWKDLRLDGTCLEGEGFAPDVAVEAKPSDFEKSDPVIERALKLLREPK
jgi:hypothetical protein